MINGSLVCRAVIVYGFLAGLLVVNTARADVIYVARSSVVTVEHCPTGTTCTTQTRSVSDLSSFSDSVEIDYQPPISGAMANQDSRIEGNTVYVDMTAFGSGAEYRASSMFRLNFVADTATNFTISGDTVNYSLALANAYIDIIGPTQLGPDDRRCTPVFTGQACSYTNAVAYPYLNTTTTLSPGAYELFVLANAVGAVGETVTAGARLTLSFGDPSVIPIPVPTPGAVPIPAAVWLLSSVLGMFGFVRRRTV